jgi:hypothetical protein
LSYDTTNVYTYIAGTDTRNPLAEHGYNKQGRHSLRQVGLSYVLDGGHGLSLCHHVYPGNVADVEEFSKALPRIIRMLDQNQHRARDGNAGVGERFGDVGLGRSGCGLDLSFTLESSAGELRRRATELQRVKEENLQNCRAGKGLSDVVGTLS